jgi:hypothetical protein
MMRFPDAPGRITKLPVDHRGFPVPWFVAFIDGKPDFRVIAPGKIEAAYHKKQCWICGEKLGKHLAFVIGPMCAITRTTSEPPSHRECAEFAARTCPFLTRPAMKYNHKNLPNDYQKPAGIFLTRNPGVTCLWISKSYKPFNADGAVLFTVGEPEEVYWYAEGRPATYKEVLRSINGGLPSLEEVARPDGEEAMQELRRMTEITMKMIPQPTDGKPDGE